MLVTYIRHGPMVFDSRELRKIFGPNRDEVTGDYINITRVIKIKNETDGACCMYGCEVRCIQGFSGVKSEGKRPLRRSSCV
jgi:hypothetical protein